jgi:hypothetical protein
MADPLAISGDHHGLAPVVHKRQWWNALIGNPLGYLPDNASVEEVSLALQPKVLLRGVPGWMSGWEFPFLLAMFMFSMGIKIAFRLQ